MNIHKTMIQDRVRTESYRDAIINNPQIFRGKQTMDIGAGTGILSLFCAQAGAKMILAVEASSLAKLTKRIIRENDC